MKNSDLAERLAPLYEVRLKRSNLAYAYRLLRDRCGFSQRRIARAIDASWGTVYRALNTDKGLTISTLAAIEDFACPALARMYARDKNVRDLARAILDAPELEEQLALRLQRVDE